MTKRKDGFYWIKLKRGWVVAEWNYITSLKKGCFYTTWDIPDETDEEDCLEIDEKQIVR